MRPSRCWVLGSQAWAAGGECWKGGQAASFCEAQRTIKICKVPRPKMIRDFKRATAGH